MEDVLNNFENGRRPQKLWKWKTTSKFLKMEGYPNSPHIRYAPPPPEKLKKKP